MVGEIVSGIKSLTAPFDIAKRVKEINDTAVAQAISVELNAKLMEAQSAQAALIERVDTLEMELMRFETWDAEKQRYELKELYRGVVAYILKPEERAGQPHYAICPNCYNNRIASVLQSNGAVRAVEHAWNCPRCKTSYPCGHKQMDQMIANLDA